MSQYGAKFPKRSLLIALAALPLALAGCTTEKPGNPTPSIPAPSTSGQGSSASPQDAFGDLKACDLLEPIASSLGFDPPAAETYESDNGCGSSKPRYGTVAVYLVPNAGITELKTDTGEMNQITVAGRKAVELPGSAGKGACLIGIAVAEKARATVNLGLSNSGTTEQACTDAKSIAEQIAPKLPQGS
ncbi:Putative secreted protein [Amycolatopsis japonica]|uniref:Putative secreted protein n=1 Tax=Amycolatopsis japonica TaxID=208439 RepID=A0A075V501_9PSEU|nr:DUF3558 family protein [Amycolatopsis japonica]AIG80338.1 Putative secreted protein [Amycolatopsis japonica]